jgi:hypothetical protein
LITLFRWLPVTTTFGAASDARAAMARVRAIQQRATRRE